MVLDHVSLFMSMPGEEITDASIWMKKSHDPMAFHFDPIINKTNKMIVMVRNPFDTIYSTLNLLAGSN